MIRAIRANHDSFHKVTLAERFNVIIADRTKESTKKDSRNGLGKTTLIEIVHFCLGAGTTRGKGLMVEALADWSFSVDMILRTGNVSVTRSTKQPGFVTVIGDDADWPSEFRTVNLMQEHILSVSSWNDLLGWLMFDLPVSVAQEKYAPSFRSLVSYFIRRGRDAFSTPFEHHRKQMEWDKQVNSAFLLGLNWRFAQGMQGIREKERALIQLRDAARVGIMPMLIGSIGELETTRVRLEGRVGREREQLAEFRVHPQYRLLEDEVDAMTREIQQLSNGRLIDRRRLEYYQDGRDDASESEDDRVVRLYEEMGVVFPGNIRRRLDEARNFYTLVVSHRREFVRQQVADLQRRIGSMDERIEYLSNARARILSVLQRHGALDEYTAMQRQYVEVVSELEDVKRRIAILRSFEQDKSSLRIDQEKMRLAAMADFVERRAVRDMAISLFNENSEELYTSPGRLVIDINSRGFRFDVEIERSSSQGVEQMKVFCFDLMIAELESKANLGPRALIHDSTIFDGVDERQVARALQLAERRSRQYGFQYICFLNSDLIPWREFGEQFDLRSYVVLQLTDASPDGSLLGIRF